MKFDPEQVRREKNENFEKAWIESGKFIQKNTLEESYPRLKPVFGKPHPVYETIQKLREAYMRMGFAEYMNPLIVEERDIYKQFGDEAPAVLDRCFYLAGLPRPNVGISDERIRKIKEIIVGIDDDGIEIIRKVLHAYKKGTIEGDDLVSELAEQLNVTDVFVTELIDKVFPEFKELKPEGTSKTLRSHMTSGWFITLSELLERNEPPFSLFSIDRCFRREQQEDASRLMTYYSASCVIMDENVTIDHGKMVAEGLLSQFGFEKFMFRPDNKRSKYYAPDTQIEVYAYHPKLDGSNTKYSDGWIEVATFGIYAAPALSEYNIPMPVMNLGLGVERLAMILYDAKDMRYMTYPQFSQYGDWEMEDSELARQVELIQTPKTDAGREIAGAIVEGFRQYGKEAGPCSFEIWSGELCGKTVTVSVVEPESDTSLAGPATFNEVVAYNGDLLGVPNQKKWEKALENHSARTGFTFVNAFAAAAAAEAEEAVLAGATEHESRVRMVKMLSEVNMKLTDLGQRYMTGNNKKIDVRGPVFTTVQFKIE
ncbi:O-phosphoserine--tRNA ligase [Methanimicrococcus blatticola]|uniref:O-phosphoserine--tRNA(Cys) ligase n=1 Tax=Methanimicrococcus blatticola TaxID=91560 RepID=A0A484F4F3_9EURY|nr:O-phosphoserine--tRNA ligase [Methanimicrococcus blatticola]MBZ3935673.1 O-phosphoserine--tRNA ligase [Methanimicrococcus blatticola]MCC2508206.1 O-phosphoserine--tRNA ligase [Methanimicrococcus blatticola]TDQ68716.1 phosphoserine-tRNA(Cys) ligase [Methanimicrococcus blatticola]